MSKSFTFNPRMPISVCSAIRQISNASVEDLDANFEITFVEGGRTPLSDSVMQQNLVALLQPYGVLWETATKGGPAGVFAKNYMKVLAERFDLPKDLHPEELESELAMES